MNLNLDKSQDPSKNVYRIFLLQLNFISHIQTRLPEHLGSPMSNWFYHGLKTDLIKENYK